MRDLGLGVGSGRVIDTGFQSTGPSSGATIRHVSGIAEVDEAELQQVVRRSRPHHLVDHIPSSLRPWLLPVSWDRDRLWSIAKPTERVSVDELRWHYELPWWRGEDRRWFRVRPAEYLAEPERFPEHDQRVAAADLSYPLHGFRRRGRVQLLDGIHRLVHADKQGRGHVDVMLLTIEDLSAIVYVDD